ncbi:MAG: hypothetical protein EOP12_03035 [Pseudomonas sp.]|nr:MAG: hypothetical protein EOP12_03035 [Pseudomonas sp.]
MENHSALEIEKTFEKVISFHSVQDVEEALIQVMISQQTPAFDDQVVDIYRISTAAQKADTLNAILNTLGKKQMLLVDNSAIKSYINENSVVFTEAQALQIIPAQVGKIVQQSEKFNPALMKALCKVYAKSFILMNALGLDVITKLIEKLKLNHI